VILIVIALNEILKYIKERKQIMVEKKETILVTSLLIIVALLFFISFQSSPQDSGLATFSGDGFGALAADESSDYWADSDEDGLGAGDPVFTHEPEEGWVTTDGDCDDSDSGIGGPGTDDDGLPHNDCDDDGADGYDLAAGGPDECDAVAGVITPNNFYVDGDGDGFGDPGVAIFSDCSPISTPPAGYANNAGDCDDSIDFLTVTYSFYDDDDGDGFGSGSSVELCEPASSPAPAGYSEVNGDCDDTDGEFFPGSGSIEGSNACEVCNTDGTTSTKADGDACIYNLALHTNLQQCCDSSCGFLDSDTKCGSCTNDCTFSGKICDVESSGTASCKECWADDQCPSGFTCEGGFPHNECRLPSFPCSASPCIASYPLPDISEGPAWLEAITNTMNYYQSLTEYSALGGTVVIDPVGPTISIEWTW